MPAPVPVTASASRWDSLARGVGVVVLAAGILGLIGHFLGIDFLLQPFGVGRRPSAFAALNLVVLGAASVAMVGRRPARIAASLAGLALACFGTVAAVESASHVVTDRAGHPTAEPALGLVLGTATCLALQGVSVALVAFRPQARAPLAVASTLTAGVALASLLAYATAVPLLRRYGIEMALLIAIPLGVHAAGMLAWAWNTDVAEHEAPMPAWSPLVAAVSAGAIFVVFTIAVEGDAAILQIVLVLGAAGKLGQTVHQQLKERRADVAARRAAVAAQVRAEERSERALAQRRWMEEVLDLAPVPLVLIDPAGEAITFANQAADRLAGGRFPRATDPRFAFVDALGEPLEHDDAPVARVARGERLDGLDVVARAPGGPRDLLVSGALLPPMQGQPPVAVLALQDVTRLHRAEEVMSRLGRIIDESPTEVYAFDASTLRLVQENAGALRNLGYRGEDLRHTSILRLWPELTRDALEALLEPLRTGEHEQVTVETVHARRDGTRYPVEARIRLSRSETPPVFVALVENITARKRVEAERAQLLALERDARRDADLASERLGFLVDASRMLADAEDLESTQRAAAQAAVPRLATWCVVHLATSDGAVRRAAIAAADDSQGVAGAIARDAPVLNEGSALQHAVSLGESSVLRRPSEAEIRDALGLSTEAGARAAATLGALACAVLPLRARSRTLGALTLVDGQDASKWTAPVELGLAHEYATRVALAIDSAQLHEDARAALRARDDFLIVASQDLAIPLSLLKMHIESTMRLARRPGGVPADRLARFLETAHRLTTKLSVVVGDVVDPSRVTSDRLALSIERVDLAGLVCTVVARFAQRLAQAGCVVELDAPRAVEGAWDAFRLEQVVANLLSNAIKYGAGKPIEVAVGADGDTARLRVRDHGVGMSEDRRARVFSLAARAVSTRHYGGVGLGMVLVKRVVEALGGTIQIDTDPGAGTTFTLILPRRLAELGALREESAA